MPTLESRTAQHRPVRLFLAATALLHVIAACLVPPLMRHCDAYLLVLECWLLAPVALSIWSMWHIGTAGMAMRRRDWLAVCVVGAMALSNLWLVQAWWQTGIGYLCIGHPPV